MYDHFYLTLHRDSEAQLSTLVPVYDFRNALNSEIMTFTMVCLTMGLMIRRPDHQPSSAAVMDGNLPVVSSAGMGTNMMFELLGAPTLGEG